MASEPDMTAGFDTKGPDLAYLRQLAQAGQKVAAPRVIIPPVTLLSLLDRIEELEAAHLNCPSLEEHGYGSHE